MRGNTANGPNIRRRRKRLGLTQEDLANRAEVDVKTIRNAELGRNLDTSTLQRIAMALTVELSYIAVTSSDSGRRAQRQIRTVHKWLEAFNDRDVDRMLMIYHHDAVLTYPSSTDMPGGGTHRGKDQLRSQAEASFAGFEIEPLNAESLRVHCSTQFVFVRGAVTAKATATGQSFTAECLHEFEFRGEDVIRHTVLLDTAAIERALKPGS